MQQIIFMILICLKQKNMYLNLIVSFCGGDYEPLKINKK